MSSALTTWLPPIRCPDVHDIHELFDLIKPYTNGPKDPPLIPSYSLREKGCEPRVGICTREGDVPMGPYCIYRDGMSLAVYPNYKLAKLLQGLMLWIQYDSLHFEIIDHDDGTSLVTVGYSQIIGSHWLAHVKTSTIPRFSEKT